MVTEVKGLITITTTIRRTELNALQAANEKFCLKELIGTMILLKILDLPKEDDPVARLADLFS